MIERHTPSPCIAVCFLDEDDVCTGCHRSSREIQDWQFMGSEQKYQVLLLCNERSLVKK
ncbi:DUF1289 domain-containing protein [Porticoccaceae bacterium]|nr:DUF1289 domain-containing protein [Porticoccaceae bacterium]MDA7589169.1 DUF1289 domain-containing protein [Porticoccaceae bacterium]MDB3883976.1 DUF1289 domain-containing protein [Porticoccaceae bacterium]MDC0370253.1 DUF1289 domain-containing protein [Porticoccaceae bacterium]MDC3199117.1 DUF1289 domain-containing protein [Porticoccaceae bacterium]